MTENALHIQKMPGVGSDGHVTTRLMLTMLEEMRVHVLPKTVLDIGCGSGILAMTAARLFDCDTMAVDIAEEAVALAMRNVAHNHLAARVRVIQSDGLKHPELRKSAPYELILCNLLAMPILAMAADIARTLASSGYLVLSGIQQWQAVEVKEYFSALQLVTTAEFQHDGWVCLLLYKG